MCIRDRENGTNLVSAGAIHYEPFGVYAGKTTSLDELQDGATIAVPNDTTNEARALLLLEAQGLIKLKEDAGLTATKNDIVENPKNLQLYEVEAAQLPRVIGDVDVAAVSYTHLSYMKQLNSYEVIEKWLSYVFFRTIGGIILSTSAEEIKKRRTFAIISHPDAGKTTLTEKFLLYGGAINLAGTVTVSYTHLCL